MSGTDAYLVDVDELGSVLDGQLDELAEHSPVHHNIGSVGLEWPDVAGSPSEVQMVFHDGPDFVFVQPKGLLVDRTDLVHDVLDCEHCPIQLFTDLGDSPDLVFHELFPELSGLDGFSYRLGSLFEVEIGQGPDLLRVDVELVPDGLVSDPLV